MRTKTTNTLSNATDLLENYMNVHVHGETAEMEQGLVGGQILLNDVLPVDRYQRHGNEQVEVVGLVVRPARLPHPQRIGLGELPLETQQDPPGRRGVVRLD